jgi:hypothetical protein
MIEGWISWTVIVALIAVGVVTHRVHQSRMTALREKNENDRADLERCLENLRDEQRRDMAETQEVHQQNLREIALAHESRLSELVTAEEGAQARAKRFHEMATKNVDWDLRSRALVLEACRNVGLHGVLATNVMFIPKSAPSASPFVLQIDHVLLTESFAMVIENKGWAGVVFDGVSPSSQHDALGALVNEDDLDGAYSVQIVRRKGNGLTVRTHTRGDSPRTQVRRHASQLFKRLEHPSTSVPWFRTCVLYSNSRLRLYAGPNPAASDDKETSVVSGLAQLQSVLSNADIFERRRTKRVPIKTVGEQLSYIAGDMCGFGKYAQTWQSPL